MKEPDSAAKQSGFARYWKPLCFILCLVLVFQGLLSGGLPEFVLGTMRLEGTIVGKDAGKAESWLHRAANKGHAGAQHTLGVLYLQGREVAKNTRKALEFFTKAAEQGFARSQGALGAMYFQGRGVRKDMREAVKWLRKAADQGDEDARKILALINMANNDTPGKNATAGQNSAPKAGIEVEERLTLTPGAPARGGAGDSGGGAGRIADKRWPPTHTNSLGMEFVLIPPGSFFLRYEAKTKNEAGEVVRYKQKMRISKPFYLGKYEVTQEQWMAVMGEGNNPSQFKGPRNPVERVSWYGAQEFIKRLNAREGHSRYRLPTEVEWELAARGGTDTLYFFGDSRDTLPDYAWYKSNSGGSSLPVGLRKPNPYGLYDIYGNVQEWVQDWYANVPPNREQTDFRGPARGEYRGARGGSWDADGFFCSSHFRGTREPDERTGFTGFRLALTPEE